MSAGRDVLEGLGALVALVFWLAGVLLFIVGLLDGVAYRTILVGVVVFSAGTGIFKFMFER